jgi:FMN phosphatase YigB (HAD superfamily)
LPKSQEDYPVEFVLDSVEAIMVSAKRPKVLLFDIGGVCVVSPFHVILDYEISKGIPPGWVNTCISKSKPNGWWHRCERGEVPMDAIFFHGFNNDLHNPQHWHEFYASQRKRQNLPEKTPPVPDIDGERLFWDMMGDSRTPDPWMYPALKELKASGKFLLAALSNTMVFPLDHPFTKDWRTEVHDIFDIFISSAHVGLRKPEPEMYQLALEKLNKYAKEHASSKGKGLGWEKGIRPEDIVFLDDIGENLKAGKQAGFETIKVPLGKAYEAVDALERVTGLQLAGDHPKIAVVPRAKL